MKNIDEYVTRFVNILDTKSKQNYFPLSIEQESLWIDDKLLSVDGKDALVETTSFRIKGEVEYEKLKNVFLEVVSAHDILKSKFEVISDIVVQRKTFNNLEYGTFNDLSTKNSVEVNDILKNSYKNLINIDSKVIDFILFKFSSHEFKLIIYAHHLVCDHSSLIKIVERFFIAYAEGNEKNKSPNIELELRDYESVLKRREKQEDNEAIVEYWKKSFIEDLPLVQLPQDNRHLSEASGHGEQIINSISGSKYSQFKDIARNYKVTPYVFLISIFYILLNKLSQAEKISLFVALNIRDKDTQNELGYFINSLPCICDITTDASFSEFLLQVQNNTRNVSKIRDFPFAKVNTLFDYDRKLPFHPLQRFTTRYTNYKPFSRKYKDCEFIYEPVRTTSLAGADLSLIFVDNTAEISIEFTYNKDIYKKITAQNMLNKYMNLFEQVLKTQDILIRDLTILTDEEQTEQLEQFNNTHKDYDKSKTIHQLFEEQVVKTPNNIAVVFESQSLTYNELNKKANKLAHYLINEGVMADEIIGLCVERSLEMVIGLIAILKSGGAYVPIDPKYPNDRIEYMIEDSNARIILTQESIKEKLPKNTSIKICIDTYDLKNQAEENPITKTNAGNLIYVIYTSGSTGQPKGVMVKHKGVNNLLRWYVEDFNLDEQSSTVLISSLSFDLTQKNLSSLLTSGGKLIIPKSDEFNPTYLLNLISKNKCSFINCAPSAFYSLLEASSSTYADLLSVKHVFLGGEGINLDLIKEWLNNTNSVLVNSYGPTECSDVVSSYKLESLSADVSIIPIGRPINNTLLYILDKDNNLVTKGAQGELHIAGDGVAKGYLNKPEMTDAKFIKNPFLKNSTMYKTGDLVRYLEAGNIEYLGRIDDQVKIRGFRIELGEIEQKLVNIKEIKESVVLAKDDNSGQKVLVSYIVIDGNSTLNLKDIRQELSQHLPEFMVPSSMVILDEMPLTPNAKTDKKALMKMEIVIESTNEYVAPSNKKESQLVDIFSEILKIEKVGTYDDFFELGGHSLLAVVLLSKINNLFNTSLSLSVLFQAPTVKKLSLLLDEKDNIKKILVPIQEKGKKTPIFVLPAVGGSTVIYKELSENLGDSQPVYGLDTLNNSYKISPLTGVVDAAKANLNEMKSIPGEGPYHLIGFCSGASIAYEMARLAPDKIKSIIMLNAYSPSKPKKPIEHLKAHARLSIYALKSTLNKLMFSGKFVRTGNGRYNTICNDFYKPQKITKDVNIALCCVKNDEYQQDNEYAEAYFWCDLLSKKLEIKIVKGEHLTLLRGKNAETLSKTIQEYYESLNRGEHAY